MKYIESAISLGTPRRDRVLSILRKEREQVLRAFGISLDALYGSVARDEATVDSDIDIFSKSTEKSSRSFERAERYLTSVFRKEGLIPDSHVEISSSKAGNWRFVQQNKKDFLELYPGAVQDLLASFRTGDRKKAYSEYEEDELEVLHWVNEADISLEESALIVKELLDLYLAKTGRQAKYLRGLYFKMKSVLISLGQLDNKHLPFRNLRGKSLRRKTRLASLSQLKTSGLVLLLEQKLKAFEKARDKYEDVFNTIFSRNHPLSRFNVLQDVRSDLILAEVYLRF